MGKTLITIGAIVLAGGIGLFLGTKIGTYGDGNPVGLRIQGKAQITEQQAFNLSNCAQQDDCTVDINFAMQAGQKPIQCSAVANCFDLHGSSMKVTMNDADGNTHTQTIETSGSFLRQ